MSDLNIFTEGTQQQILDELKVQNALVKVLASGWNINSFAAVREIVKGGGGKRYFPVGTQFTVPHTAYGGGLLFDVVAHDVHKNPNDLSAPTMTLLMHHCIYGRQFDGFEAAYVVTADNYEGGLPAGTYHFLLPTDYAADATADGWTGIQFTTTKTVPVGGQIVIHGWTYNVHITNVKIRTYESALDMTGIETNLTLTDGTSGTCLGTFKQNSQAADGVINHYTRLRYGSNNWNESNIRQWLNADAASGWFVQKTPFDRLDSVYANLEGFMNGLDPEFLSVVGAVDVTTRKNSVYESDSDYGAKVYTTRDKFFLISNDEAGYGVEGIAQGSVLDLYNGAANVDRIKYDLNSQATARIWWLRSPDPGYASTARYVVTSGAQSGNHAYNGLGAAAACVIY